MRLFKFEFGLKVFVSYNKKIEVIIIPFEVIVILVFFLVFALLSAAFGWTGKEILLRIIYYLLPRKRLTRVGLVSLDTLVSIFRRQSVYGYSRRR